MKVIKTVAAVVGTIVGIASLTVGIVLGIARQSATATTTVAPFTTTSDGETYITTTSMIPTTSTGHPPDPCASNVSNGYIKFPVVGEYQRKSNCTWQISSNMSTEQMILIFDPIDLPSTDQFGQCDPIHRLEIEFEDRSVSNTFCGTDPLIMILRENKIVLEFRSGGFKPMNGFTLNYSFHTNAVNAWCESMHVETEYGGIISSSRYPWVPNFICSWTISPINGANYIAAMIPQDYFNSEIQSILTMRGEKSNFSFNSNSLNGRTTPIFFTSSPGKLTIQLSLEEIPTLKLDKINKFKIYYTNTVKPNSPGYCGDSKSNGGSPSKPNYWQWLADIQISGINRINCAGVLIHPLLVVTSARCLKQRSDGIIVRFVGSNSYEIQRNDEIIPTQNHLSHPNYNDASKENDIGLIRLSFPSKMNPICLPKINETLPSVDDNLTLTSWQVNNTADERYSFLQEDYLKVATKCSSTDPNMPKSFFCADSIPPMEDSVYFQDGVPLLRQNSSGNYYLTGITAIFKKPDHPIVFLQISKYIDWINEIIETI